MNSRLIWMTALLTPGLWGLCDGVSPFVRMCLVSFSLFFLIKLHVLVEFRFKSNPLSKVRKNGDRNPRQSGLTALSKRDQWFWFVAWPGLNAAEFFTTVPARHIPREDWGFAGSKTAAGGFLFWILAPRMLSWNKWAAGWTALAGVVFMLHFGLFHWMALFWQSKGRNVRPIMNWPVMANSLADFWSRRWNLAFRDYAHSQIFTPLSRWFQEFSSKHSSKEDTGLSRRIRRIGPMLAILVGYAFSGIIHELAISVPAEAGYGLPTLYFAIQGAGIVTERIVSRQLIRINDGWLGRFWALLVAGVPAVILFHHAFVVKVVVPLLQNQGH
ncbi:MAG: hypothetical protein KDA91_05895 [Planctomycetaceae bacterium]|nr:hypothetical protein [Planctomycetaceae bacterium]